jgi:hypothetical protein
MLAEMPSSELAYWAALFDIRAKERADELANI